MIARGLFIESTVKKLRIFDFDDTIVLSEQMKQDVQNIKHLLNQIVEKL